MSDFSGEKFIDKLYSNLYISSEVQHTKENNDKRYEAIRKYFERLQRVHEKADTENKKKLLKSLYIEKYVIKEDILMEKYNIDTYSEEEQQEKINMVMNAQKQSLSKWIDYLSDSSANYPLWAKYWAFQGMLKMGSYDEFKGIYLKRDEKTEAPFVECNPEIIAKCIDTIIKSVNKEEITEEIEEKLSKTDSFSKIYRAFEKQYKKNIIENTDDEGIWIKYNQGSKEDAIRLSKSLDGKSTQWCTSSEDTAIRQVCGPYGNAKYGGDFYVYYSKDKNGEYTTPRIAMRLKDHDEIGEIRGIEEGQNLEERMISVLEAKLNEMTFLSKKDVEKALEKIDGLKELTIIGKKTEKKEELTEKELNDLYTNKFGFGWVNDPRTTKIMNKRDWIKDFENAKDYEVKKIIFNHNYYESKNFEIKDGNFLKFYLNNYTSNSTIIKKVNPENVTNYEELATLSVTKWPITIQYINPKYVSNYEELATMVINKDSSLIQYIDLKYVSNYEELATIVINKDFRLIQYIDPKYISNYDDFIEKIVKHNPHIIKYINPKYVSNYGELSRKAILLGAYIYEINEDYQNQELYNIYYVLRSPYELDTMDPKKFTNYEELARTLVSYDGSNIQYINKDYISNYDELAMIAVKNDGFALNYIRKEDVSNYDEIAKEAIKTKYLVFKKIKKEDVSNYEELEEIYLKSREESKSKHN